MRVFLFFMPYIIWGLSSTQPSDKYGLDSEITLKHLIKYQLEMT